MLAVASSHVVPVNKKMARSLNPNLAELANFQLKHFGGVVIFVSEDEL